MAPDIIPARARSLRPFMPRKLRIANAALVILFVPVSTFVLTLYSLCSVSNLFHGTTFNVLTHTIIAEQTHCSRCLLLFGVSIEISASK